MVRVATRPRPLAIQSSEPHSLKDSKVDHRLSHTFKWVMLFLHAQVRPTPLPSLESLHERHNQSAGKPINLLCLDGGGIRGRNLLAIVEEIEATTGTPVGDLFDLVGGTSIGGCGALFISRYSQPGMATRMARTALQELAGRCFAQRGWRRLVLDGHFCHDARRDLLLKLCGSQQPIVGGSCRAFAVAARRRGRHVDPFLFRTYQQTEAQMQTAIDGTSQAELWQAVEATSAAPMVFPESRLRGMDLADGGVVANDPTLIAIHEARTMWPDRPLGLVVSLGTGAARPASEPEAHIVAAVQQAGGKYFRIEPPVRGISAIEANEAKLTQMEEMTREYFRSSDLAREMCDRLMHEARARSSRATLRVAAQNYLALCVQLWLRVSLCLSQFLDQWISLTHPHLARRVGAGLTCCSEQGTEWLSWASGILARSSADIKRRAGWSPSLCSKPRQEPSAVGVQHYPPPVERGWSPRLLATLRLASTRQTVGWEAM